MRDLLGVVLVGAFFAVCIAYEALCDRIVGPDAVDAEPEPEQTPDSVPASEVAS